MRVVVVRFIASGNRRSVITDTPIFCWSGAGRLHKYIIRGTIFGAKFFHMICG